MLRLVVAALVVCLKASWAIAAASRSAVGLAELGVGLQKLTPQASDATAVDESRYSRQLFVYGKSAQAKLANGKAIIVGKGGLLDEVVKNLALTGVGHLILVETGSVDSSLPSLRGGNPRLSASSYARSLNSALKVESLSLRVVTSSDLVATGADVVVVCDGDLDLWKAVNRNCRRHGVKMVAAHTEGMVGSVFNDFLDSFEADVIGGEPLEVPLTEKWEVLSEEGLRNRIVISCIPEERMCFGEGDCVTLRSVRQPAFAIDGVVVSVFSPQRCVLRLDNDADAATAIEAISRGECSVQQAKRRVSLGFQPLSSQLLRPRLLPTNACLSPARSQALALALLAMAKAAHNLRSASRVGGKRISRVSARAALDQELSSLRKTVAAGGEKERQRLQSAFGQLEEQGVLALLVDNVLLFEERECAATVSVVGGMAAEEAVKALTGLHMPALQFLTFEALHALPHAFSQDQLSLKAIREIERAVRGELRGMKIAVVGAGAIGCELIKNLALLGAACGSGASANPPRTLAGGLWGGTLSGGGVVVTDPDSIERTNLHRQLLFRERHVGSSKSAVAAEQARTINPAMRIVGLSQKVSARPSESLSSAFWSGSDLVLSALDNFEGRRCVDQLCWAHERYLVDSGTLGIKSNVQVVVPHLTETYSSSTDPVDPAVPVCTIKTFPYQPSHCVAWAKETFGAIYGDDVRAWLALVNSTASARVKTVQALSDEQVGSLLWATSFAEARAMDGGGILTALRWAGQLFVTHYQLQVAALLSEHPVDAKDEDQQPFWGGARRLPRALPIDLADPLVREHLVNTAFLRLRSLGLPASVEAIQEELYRHEQLVVCGLETWRADFVGAVGGDAAHPGDRERVLLAAEKSLHWRSILQPQDFDKDDLPAGHVRWIASAANLRSRVYGLRELSTLEVQREAGNIIPALATSTAVAAGLVSHEVLKIASERVARRREALAARPSSCEAGGGLDMWLQRLRDLRGSTRGGDTAGAGNYEQRHASRLLARLRNSFVDLAVPQLMASEPVSAERIASLGRNITLWDRFDAVGAPSELTLRRLERDLGTWLGRRLQITSVVCGELLLYAEFFPEQRRLRNTPLSKLVNQACAQGLAAGEGWQEGVTGGMRLEMSARGLGADEAEEEKLPAVMVRSTRAGAVRESRSDLAKRCWAWWARARALISRKRRRRARRAGVEDP